MSVDYFYRDQRKQLEVFDVLQLMCCRIEVVDDVGEGVIDDVL
jgi:hypothetical protein